MKDLIIIGAGGLGREVLQYAKDAYQDRSQYRIKGFLDDNPDSLAGFSLDTEIIGNTVDYEVQANDQFIIAIANPDIYQQIANRFIGKGATFFSIIHPLAYVAPTAKINSGCVIAPFSFIGSFAELASHVIVNVYASIGHDAQVSSYCVFSPYSVINGHVNLGERVFLGTQAVVVVGRSVGSGTKISAGAVAYRNIPENALVVGNPGKFRVLFASQVDAREGK